MNLNKSKTVSFSYTPLHLIGLIVIGALVGFSFWQWFSTKDDKEALKTLKNEFVKNEGIIEFYENQIKEDSIFRVGQFKKQEELDSLLKKQTELVFYYKNRAFINAKKYSDAQNKIYNNSNDSARTVIFSNLLGEN